MSKLIPALMGVAVLGLAACQSSLPPGHYESSHSTKNPQGTNVKTEKETDVYYDQNGDKKATTKTTTTTDPKGLFNKSKTTTTETR